MKRFTLVSVAVLGLAGLASACDPCGGVVGASALYAPRVVMYAPVVQQAPAYQVQAAPVYQAAPQVQAAPCPSAAVMQAPAYAPAFQAAPVVQYAVPSVPLAAVVVRQQAVYQQSYAPAASAVVVRQAAPAVVVKQAAPVVVARQAAPARGLFGRLRAARAESAAAAGGGQAVQQRGIINLNR